VIASCGTRLSAYERSRQKWLERHLGADVEATPERPRTEKHRIHSELRRNNCRSRPLKKRRFRTPIGQRSRSDRGRRKRIGRRLYGEALKPDADRKAGQPTTNMKRPKAKPIAAPKPLDRLPRQRRRVAQSLPRSQAPELGADLSAMRELANQSAAPQSIPINVKASPAVGRTIGGGRWRRRLGRWPGLVVELGRHDSALRRARRLAFGVAWMAWGCIQSLSIARPAGLPKRTPRSAPQ